MYRAAHQIFDSPRVLDDPIALPILGSDAVARLVAEPSQAASLAARSVRAYMVARSRYAEDELARAIGRGARQYVILGAGLDTFAYRNPHAEAALRVFEVDHPATQAWKRERLAAAGIRIPGSLIFAPVDFERESLSDGLEQTNFEREAVTFFSWLGVTPYLTSEAMTATLAFIASMPTGSGVVFDYALPRSSLNWLGRLIFDRLAERVAAAGEPFRLFSEPESLRGQLCRMGFTALEDLGAPELNARYFRDGPEKIRVRGRLGRLISASL
jgi:methyltransferase (TIGR00027 family)